MRPRDVRGGGHGPGHVIGVNRLPASGARPDDGEDAEPLHEARNRADVAVATRIVDKGRPEDRPRDTLVHAVPLHRVLGPPERLRLVPFPGIRALQLEPGTGGAQGDQPIRAGDTLEQSRERRDGREREHGGGDGHIRGNVLRDGFPCKAGRRIVPSGPHAAAEAPSVESALDQPFHEIPAHQARRAENDREPPGVRSVVRVRHHATRTALPRL